MSAKGMVLLIVLAAVVILAGGAIPSSAARAPSDSLDLGLAPATPPLGPEFLISTHSTPYEADRHRPAIAHNWTRHEYLVVWHNQWTGNRDIYAQRLAESGQFAGPWFAVSYGTGDRFNAAVAYNATNEEYLVVWQKEVASGVFEVWGRRIKWNGADMGLPQYAEFKIFSWANRSFMVPRVAWNSYRNEYLVVWTAYDTSDPNHPYTDVAGILVQADGSMPYSQFIVSNVGHPRDVDIVYNVALDGYMVVWARDGGTSGYDIYAVFLDRYGAKINPPGEFAVTSGLSPQREPAVTTNEQNHYMVVWQHRDESYVPGDWDIYGRLFQADGSGVTTQFLVAGTQYDETSPDVAANPANQEYLTVWQRDAGGQMTVRARLRNSAGTLEPPIVISRPQVWDVRPVVACDVPSFLIAYEKEPADYITQHIYGRKWLSEAGFLPLTLRKYTN